jgi:hypothetical protein
MVFRDNKIFTIIMALGVIGAVVGLADRHSAEMHNRAVEVAVDYSEVAQLSGASHRTVPETLASLKSAGVTSVAIQERTVGELVSSGSAIIRPQRTPGKPTVTLVGSESQDLLAPLIASGRTAAVPTSPRIAPYQVAVPGEPEYVLSLPTGLPGGAVSAVRQAGLAVVARLVNYPGVDTAGLEHTTELLSRDGVHTVIFAADQVLGFRGAVDKVADALKGHNLAFGSVEFSKQKGDQRLSEKMLPNVIRVHSITGAEMGGIDRASAIERFVKGAKERNIRLAYVRMFDLSDSNPLDTNMDYISAIASGLRQDGFTVEPAHPFKDPDVPLTARMLMGLGVAAGAMLLLLSLFGVSGGLKWGFFTVLAVMLAGAAAPGIPIGLKIVALASALTFPTLAILYVASETPAVESKAPLRAYLWPAVARSLSAIAITGAGGLIVAGLLSKLSFMLHIEQFAGVKFAQMLPLLVVAAAFVAGIGWGPDSWHAQKRKAEDALRKVGAQPILIWQTVVGLALLVMLALLMARSGNDSGLEVSALELKFRSILDTLLFVRPRTKEFLIGHPAMLLGTAAALGGRRNWAALLLVIGMFGEVSLLNTFCHIHTPIAISIIRCAIGAVLGLAIGAALLLIFSRPGRVGRKGVGVRK